MPKLVYYIGSALLWLLTAIGITWWLRAEKKDCEMNGPGLRLATRDFDTPTPREIARLAEGDFVKLQLADEFTRGFFWVEIEGRDGDIFLGSVIDCTAGAAGLEFGDELTFTAKHIVGFEIPDDPWIWHGSRLHEDL